jgi:hypothetical protein
MQTTDIQLSPPNMTKITTALIKAGFHIERKPTEPERLYIAGENYTITCYWDEDLQQWRLYPYDDRVSRTVREALTDE